MTFEKANIVVFLAFLLTHLQMVAFLGPWATIPVKDDIVDSHIGLWDFHRVMQATPALKDEYEDTSMMIIAFTAISLLVSVLGFVAAWLGSMNTNVNAVLYFLSAVFNIVAIILYFTQMGDYLDSVAGLEPWFVGPIFMVFGIVNACIAAVYVKLKN